MARLQASYIKIVAAGGDLAAAAEKKLANEALEVEVAGSFVPHETSANPNPVDRYEDGTTITIRGALYDVTEADIVFLNGGAVDGNGVYTKSQALRTLPKYDLEVGVKQTGKTDEAKLTYTDMQFADTTTYSYQRGQVTILPFVAMSTDTTTREEEPGPDPV